MNITIMYKFCDTEFWDTKAVWYSDKPQFSDCFRNTALVWLPSLLMLPMVAYEVSTIIRSQLRPIPRNLFNGLRLLLTNILFVLKVSQAFIYLSDVVVEGKTDFFNESDTIVVTTMAAPLLKALGYITLATIYHCQRRAGRHTSGPVWFFLFLSLICDSLNFFSLIISLQSPALYVREFTVECLNYPILLMLFLVECRGDRPIFNKETDELGPHSPKLEASFLSRFTFWWLNDMFGGKPINFSTLWKVDDKNQVDQLVPNLEREWAIGTQDNRASRYNKSGQRERKNLMLVLIKLYWKRLALSGLLKFSQDSIQYLTPMLLKLLLAHMVSPNDLQWHGILFALLLLIFPTIQSVLMGNYFCYMQSTGLEVKSMIVAAIYRKSLHLSGSVRMDTTSGAITNLMSIDTERLQDLLLMLNQLWSSPYQIGLALFLLYRELGWCLLPGVATMLVLIPINGYIYSRIKSSQMEVMRTKDARVKQTSELLAGIRVIKLYAWEESFMANLLELRNKELHHLKRMLTLEAFLTFMWLCNPFIVALVSFTVYIYADPTNVLTAEKAFVSITLFNIMKTTFTMLPAIISTLMLSMVSTRRISEFLNSEELANYVNRKESCANAIEIEHGTVCWFASDNNDDADAFVLRDINLSVKPGSLVAVVGQVASGKSSLLASILGEMDHINGRFSVCKSMSLAYAAQEAWIQNKTVRDNILFDYAYDEEHYNRIIAACCLQQDLDILPGGDQAEIGEKGINLSGGQKQRVSLARACYSNSDIYLLDDPLSALDSHVAKQVFEQVLSSETGLLREKTRILATNNLAVLPHADYIVVLKGGWIVEAGTYATLMAAPLESMDEYLRQYSKQEQQDGRRDTAELVEQENKISPAAPNRSECKMSGKLVEQERLDTGSISFKIYLSYFAAVSILWCTVVMVSFMSAGFFNVAANIWLSIWSSDWERNGMSAYNSELRNMRLIIYGALGCLQSLSTLIISLALSRGAVRAAKILHEKLLTKVLHSPMAFFDTTPIGRIVNRFAKDIDAIDLTLPSTFRIWLSCFLQVLSTVLIIGYLFPQMLVILLVLAIIFFSIQKVFIATTRQLKRLGSISKSPIYSHFNETLAGLTTIRAYDALNRFMNHSNKLIDRNQACSYPTIVANRWLSTRLELFGNIMAASIAMFSVLYKDHHEINSGQVGLAIAYSLGMTQTLSLLVRYTSDLEANIVSVERLAEYIGNKLEDLWVKESRRPPSGWPDKGGIQFCHHSASYRSDTGLVLKDLSFEIRPGEKLGVVGRTGSGKSSLALALFRMLEPELGVVMIDGRNVADYGLHDLRKRLTIIPQDPVLFSGTLRFNLDPQQVRPDVEIWRALELAHMKSYVAQLELGLDHSVSEYGENFSVGQRQLICLARAILRKTKILILDEATASVDLDTDSVVQETIRRVFADCTIITIAHRLQTILDSDRILVMSQGSVMELDNPIRLLRDTQSEFFSFVCDAGLDVDNFLAQTKS